MKANHADKQHQKNSDKPATDQTIKVKVADKRALAQANTVAAKSAISKYRKQAANQ